MDVTVINTYLNKWILLILTITMFSCQPQETHDLETLLDVKLNPPTNTYNVSLYMYGNFSCPFEMWLLLEGADYKKVVLSGVVDTIVYKDDWYGQELSFKSKTLECIDKEAVAKITWYTL